MSQRHANLELKWLKPEMVWPIETFCEKAVFNLFFLIFILGPDAKKHQKEEQHKIDNAEELTQDEQQEREVLLYEGIFISLIYITK